MQGHPNNIKYQISNSKFLPHNCHRILIINAGNLLKACEQRKTPRYRKLTTNAEYKFRVCMIYT